MTGLSQVKNKHINRRAPTNNNADKSIEDFQQQSHSNTLQMLFQKSDTCVHYWWPVKRQLFVSSSVFKWREFWIGSIIAAKVLRGKKVVVQLAEKKGLEVNCSQQLPILICNMVLLFSAFQNHILWSINNVKDQAALNESKSCFSLC